jgi:hypothetical protein
MTTTDRSKPVNHKNPEPLTSRNRAPGLGPHEGTLEEPRCTARCKARDARCKNRPMRGGKVCRVHGGAAVQVRAAAARRLAVEKVQGEVKNALAFESLEGVADPLGALSRLADESMAMKEALAARVNSLKQMRYSAHGSGTEQLRAEVSLYERALDRTAKFLDMLVRSGFEEKRIAIAQAQGLLMATALNRIFDRLELSHAQRLLIPVVVPQEIRAISAEAHRG